MHILYLEDSEPDIRFVRRYMDSVQHNFVTVNRINDAWDYLQDNQVDIFLADIIIGNELAYGLIEQVVAQGLASNVIAITAKALPNEQQYCLDLGCSRVITKPFTIDDLEYTLNECIG